MSELQSKPVIRDSAGLRDALFDEIDALRGGTSNPQRASAVAKLAIQIVNSVTMELAYHKYARHLAKDGEGDVQIGSVPALKLGAG